MNIPFKRAAENVPPQASLNSADSSESSPRQDVISSGRRNLIKGASGGVGVWLAVQSKTALGTTICQSPSAMLSGNTSPRPGAPTCSGGRSPGFWKTPNHFQYWGTAGAVPPTFNCVVKECQTGMSTLSNSNIVVPGTLVSNVLPGAMVSATTGIWSVLAFPTSYPNGQLMRHLIAAWLNAGYFASYPLTKAQVVEMWEATRSGGAYCPSSMLSCGSSGMYASDVIAYISSMYDINSDIDVDLCKSN